MAGAALTVLVLMGLSVALLMGPGRAQAQAHAQTQAVPSVAPIVPASTTTSTTAVPAPAVAPAEPLVAASAPPAAPLAAASAPPGAPADLDTRIQHVKAEVLRLNRDLLVLEEELLFPASTQVAVFLSMDQGLLFELESVQLQLNGQVVAQHLYTPQEVKALQRGGVQRLHLGNLKTGSHELVAFFTGGGPHTRDYRRGATVRFDKGREPRYVELQIRDLERKLQPSFEAKVWP